MTWASTGQCMISGSSPRLGVASYKPRLWTVDWTRGHCVPYSSSAVFYRPHTLMVLASYHFQFIDKVMKVSRACSNCFCKGDGKLAWSPLQMDEILLLADNYYHQTVKFIKRLDSFEKIIQFIQIKSSDYIVILICAAFQFRNHFLTAILLFCKYTKNLGSSAKNSKESSCKNWCFYLLTKQPN